MPEDLEFVDDRGEKYCFFEQSYRLSHSVKVSLFCHRLDLYDIVGFFHGWNGPSAISVRLNDNHKLGFYEPNSNVELTREQILSRLDREVASGKMILSRLVGGDGSFAAIGPISGIRPRRDSLASVH